MLGFLPRLRNHFASLRVLRTLRATQSLAFPRSWSSSGIANQQHSLNLLPTSPYMPSVYPEVASPHGSFDLLERAKLNFSDIVISKWQSRESGLTVVHLDYDAPIVKGYFVVATEIFNDSGCPHTLEHLVFLGSKKYPYKGVLDNLANRAFAAGTNAWTDTDHTAYTLETAGEQGFLQLLPIYVDHILYPTLTNAGFVTEVHHINEKGEDAGVVYSEMQGRENTSGDIAALRRQRLFYPPESAYRSETGGLMEALRTLSIDEIRKYHASYYVPHNLCLIVAGKLSTAALLNTIQTQVEPSIAAHNQMHGPRPEGWKRPFIETPSVGPVVLAETRKDTIEFPEKDETTGEVIVSFVGPSSNDFLQTKAIDILGIYLTDSAVSPLTKEFVEIPSPLCTYVYFYENSRPTFTNLDVYFGSVPTEHLETLDEKFKQSLQRVVREGLDMERMKLVLKRDKLKLYNDLESDGGDLFSGAVIGDFLYGITGGEELNRALAEIERYKELSSWTSQQWTDLLEKYYINNPSVVIRARPSAALAESLESTEKARIITQRETLGTVGLARLEKALKDAKAEHDRPIPNEILTGFPVPDVKSISWIPVDSVQNDQNGTVKRTAALGTRSGGLEEHIRKDPTTLPYFVQFDHVKSDFVTISAYLSTASVPSHLKPYIPVYLSSFFSLPVTRADGTRLSHEDVVKQLDNDTVAYGINLGLGGYFSEMLRPSLKVETEQYATGIAWLRDLLYSAHFDLDRLAVTIAKIQQSLPESKRDGNTVVSSVSGQLLFDETSSLQASALMTQLEFVPKLAQMIKDDPRKVVKDLEQLRSYVTDPSVLRFSVTGNVLSLPEPKTAWVTPFKKTPSGKVVPVPWASRTLSTLGKNPRKKGVVVSLPTIESSFALHTTKSISGFDHPDVAALRLACEVLDGAESFLWKFIRGAGLAYGANLAPDLESGLLSLQLYRCPDSYLAYHEAAKVVKGIADGTVALEETTVEAAKSSLVYGVARSLSSPARAATTSFSNQVLKNVPQDFGRQLLEQYQGVTSDQIKDAIRKYVLPLFDSSSSVAIVVSSPNKAEDIKKGLESVGFDVEARELSVPPDELKGGEGGSDSGSESGSEISSDDDTASR